MNELRLPEKVSWGAQAFRTARKELKPDWSQSGKSIQKQDGSEPEDISSKTWTFDDF